MSTLGVHSRSGGNVEAPPKETEVIRSIIQRVIHEEIGIEASDVSILTSKTVRTNTGDICLTIPHLLPSRRRHRSV